MSVEGQEDLPSELPTRSTPITALTPHPPPLTNPNFKYSNDILALLTDNQSVLGYYSTVAHLTQWCECNHLHLDVKKERKKDQHPILINNETVKPVDSFKYLGHTLDNKSALNSTQRTLKKEPN